MKDGMTIWSGIGIKIGRITKAFSNATNLLYIDISSTIMDQLLTRNWKELDSSKGTHNLLHYTQGYCCRNNCRTKSHIGY